MPCWGPGPPGPFRRSGFSLIWVGGGATERQKLFCRSEVLLNQLPVILIDGDAANQFDRLRSVSKIQKIGRADLLIASIALANQARLVTRNLRHFRQIPHLSLENWVD